MNRLWRRVRGALGLGVLWGIGGGFVGGMIELVMNILPGSDLFLGVDMWPAALAIPGFLAGVLFSVALWAVEGRRSFDALRLPRIGALGAVGGALLGVVIGLPLVVIGALALTSGASAMGTLALARRADVPELLSDGSDATGPGHG